jgi:hypothetical protein
MLNAIKWFFGALSDDVKNTMSLTRIIFLAACVVALMKWNSGVEITDYFFYFLLINLSYLFFKYKALDIISKILDTIISSKVMLTKKPKGPEDG